MKKTISIFMEKELLDLLNKRAKKEFLSVKELIEAIIRRSMISYAKKPGNRDMKLDDSLVSVFSRQRSGRKRNKIYVKSSVEGR